MDNVQSEDPVYKTVYPKKRSLLKRVAGTNERRRSGCPRCGSETVRILEDGGRTICVRCGCNYKGNTVKK